MPRRLAIVAAVATVLTVAACGSSQPAEAPDAQRPQDGGLIGSADAGSSLGSDASGDAAADAPDGVDPGTPGLPEGSGASIDDVLRAGAVATWVDEPDVLAISLPVAADCWPTAAPPAVVSETELEVAFAPAECGTAHTARTYTIDVPDDIEPDADFEVAVEGLAHPVTLPLPAR